MTTLSPTPQHKDPPKEDIPVGLGTSLGVLGTALAGVAGLVAAVLDGDHSSETIAALISAIFLLAVTIAGRFAQAYAKYRDNPNAAAISAVLDEFTKPATEDITEILPTKPPKTPRKR